MKNNPFFSLLCASRIYTCMFAKTSQLNHTDKAQNEC